MGCDIHMYAETLNDSGNWVEADPATFKQSHWVIDLDEEDKEYTKATNKVDTSRNYWLFGTLAEVRSEWPFSFVARGFPEDASPSVREQYEYEDGDAHTPSYLTKGELQQKAAELLISAEEGARDNAGYLQELLGKLHGAPEKQRIVFWFDN